MLPGNRSKEYSKQAKKASPQFISYLRNTPELPNKSLSKSKENMHPGHYPQVKEIKKEDRKQEGKVVQCDFSFISVSYVLDGNKLKKKQFFDERQPKAQTPLQTEKQNASTKNRKQILKLQYLEKMGVLRPEEEEILKKYRKQNPPKEQENHKVQIEPVQFYSPGGRKNYLSPKGMPANKNLTTYFSPKHNYHAQLN